MCRRGLVGGDSLAQLLARRRGVRTLADWPRLTRRRILAWADAHHGRTGSWPNRASGPIPDATGETWAAVDSALKAGRRGLTGGTSLARLLARVRGDRDRSREAGCDGHLVKPVGLPDLEKLLAKLRDIPSA